MQATNAPGAVRDTGTPDVYPVPDGSSNEDESSLRATIDLAPIGIAQFDRDGRFLLVNTWLCTTLGYTREELLARTYQDISFEEDVAACMAANAQLAAGAVPAYRMEKRFVRRDGTTVWMRVTVSAVRRPGGEFVFFVGVAEESAERDETARMMERLLALEHDARMRAERATQMRDDVLAIVAHDLRNPLHTIELAAASLLETAATNAVRTRNVEIIQHVVGTMDRLIDDLLDVSRIDTGNFPVNRKPVRLSELLDEIVRTFEPQVRERGIDLRREDISDPGMVACDRDQFMRALANLVGNAVKFTPARGRVVLRSQCDSDTLHISVEDTGPGIPPEDLPYVFDRFWQADRAAPTGVGLGLMIARGIVESHGGRIWAESAVGRGSRFHLELPLAA